MMEEFKLAVENGTMVIPVGCTGYMSQVIWDKVMEDSEKYYGADTLLIEQIKKLNEYDESKIDQITETVLETIQKSRNGTTTSLTHLIVKL